MNASAQFTTTAPDTALIARWDRQSDTGDETFSLADYDRLAELATTDAERALIADCRQVEIDLFGAVDASDDGDVDDDCGACSGTGIGRYDGPCSMCGGSGAAHDAPLFDEPYDLDDETFAAYMAGAYESAVA